jgi:hypothetical protein
MSEYGIKRDRKKWTIVALLIGVTIWILGAIILCLAMKIFTYLMPILFTAILYYPILYKLIESYQKLQSFEKLNENE